ncbi:MAG: (d)CMP kinase [Pseudomonadota bacterium]
MIITIDGPAASGKGTLARLLAKELSLAYLDTGGLYRATALAMLRSGHDLADKAAASASARALDVGTLSDPQLRAQDTGAAASKIARYPGVRSALLDFQRRFAANPPGNARGAVLDGRDTGSVICPDADVKFYVEASAQERARRRAAELAAKGEDADPSHIEAEIIARDTQDKTRKEAPLVVPPGAAILDTTALTIEEALQAALTIVAKAACKPGS